MCLSVRRVDGITLPNLGEGAVITPPLPGQNVVGVDGVTPLDGHHRLDLTEDTTGIHPQTEASAKTIIATTAVVLGTSTTGEATTTNMIAVATMAVKTLTAGGTMIVGPVDAATTILIVGVVTT